MPFAVLSIPSQMRHRERGDLLGGTVKAVYRAFVDVVHFARSQALGEDAEDITQDDIGRCPLPS